MRFLRLLCWFLMVGMFFPHNKVMAQDLKVLVLDALDGKPQAKVEVEYFCTGKFNNSPSKSTLTNPEGLAQISYLCSDEEKIELFISAPSGKEQCGTLPPLAFRDIASPGIVSRPDADGGIWCPTKVSKHLKPVPGQVIMFIKKPTWWQSHVAG